MSKQVTIDKAGLQKLRTELNRLRRCIHQIERKLDKTLCMGDFAPTDLKEDIREIIFDNTNQYNY